MTAFVGSLLTASDDTSTTASPYLANALSQWPDGWPVEDFFEAEASDVIAGPWTDNFSLGMPHNSYSGSIAHAYSRDYYNRIYCYPSQFNEHILTDMTVSFTMWNAYLYAVTCSDMDVTHPDEIQVQLFTGDIPFTIYDLQTKTVDVLLPADGSARFTSKITFDFGVSIGDVVVTITGVRLVVFGYLPLLGLVERLKYKTDIIRAKSTTEQRICLLDAPRQEFQETVYLANETEQSKLDILLHSQHKRAWGLPIWTQYTRHNGTIALGDTTISIDTTYTDYRDGGFAIIWQSESSYEVVNVETVATTGLTLVSGTLHAWTGLKYIAPLRIAYMQSKASRVASPDHNGSFSVTFMVHDTARVEDYGADLTHCGLPVLTKPSYVEDSQDVSLDADTILTDYDISDFNVASNSDYPIIVQSHVFKTNSRAEAWALRQFFDYLRGRQIAFYVPTFKSDLIQVSSLDAGGAVFNVQGAGLTANMGVNDLRTDIAFVFPDGTIIPRKITDIVKNGDEETITIDAAPGITIEPGDCEVCFLDRCRLTSDEVQIDWEEPDFAVCSVNLTRVKV